MTRGAPARAAAAGQPVTIVARLARSGDGEPITVIEDDRFTEVVLARPGPRPPGGAWVRVSGRRVDDRLVDAELELIQPAAIAPPAWPEVSLPEAACLVEPGRLAAMRQRSRLVSLIRGFLEERGFLEVQTPFLHAQAEGCQVHQLWTTGATGRRLYLRTDPEEYLKRFLTAGFEAVYEVAANVRGEALDRTHLHEFTSVEGYRRCWRFDEALGLVEELVRECLVHVSGAPVARLGGQAYDFSGPIAVASFDDLVAEHAGLRPSDHPGTEALAAAVTARSGWRGTGTELDRFRRTWLEHLLDDAVLPALTAPLFVVDFPVDLGLSGRERRGVPGACHRGELYLPGGFELAHFYENITEAGELRRRYAGRLAHRIASGLPPVQLDEELMRSAELGMPPMSGFAIGIDRLLMVALGADQVSTGLLFPREGF